MARRSPSTDRPRRRGFTLAEGLIAAVVLALAVTAISTAFSASYQQDRHLNEQMTALSLARQLLEEIVARPYYVAGEITTGPDAGDTGRATFDSIKDYRGFVEQVTTLTTLDGTQSLNLGGSYQRQVTLSYRSSPTGSVTSFGEFALLTVTVTSPGGRIVTLSQLVTAANLVQQ